MTDVFFLALKTLNGSKKLKNYGQFAWKNKYETECINAFQTARMQ